MSEKEEGRLRIPICILGEELDGARALSAPPPALHGMDGMATTNDQDGEEEEDGEEEDG